MTGDLLWSFAATHGLATAPVSWRRSGHFDVDPDGHDALVVPVWDPGGELIDLCAFEPAGGRFGTALGRAITLDRDAGHVVAQGGWARIWRHPRSWLASTEPGIAILDRRRAWIALRDITRLLAEDETHAREIERLRHPVMPKAEILVPERRRAA